MFSLVCYGCLKLFGYILRIKCKKRENEDDFKSLYEQTNFYAEWNIPVLLVIAFFKVTYQEVYLSFKTV